MSQQPKQRMLVITSEMWDQVVSGNLLKLWPAAGATQRDTWLLIFNTHFNPTPPWTVEDLGWFVTQVRRPDVARPLEPVFVRVEYREDPAAAAAADSGGVPNGIVGNNLFFGTKDAAGAVKRLFHELGGGAVGPNGQRLSETCCLCSRDCDNGRHLRDHVHQARDGSFIVVDAPPAKRRKKLPPPAAVAVEEDEDEEDEGRDPVQRFVEHLDEETCEGMRQRLRVVEAEQALREKERGQKERGQKQQGGQNGRDAGNAGPSKCLPGSERP